MPQLPGLRRCREERLLSQVELAALAGIAQPTISKLERGRSAHGATVRKLAAVLDVQPRELMSPARASIAPREERAS